MNARVLSNQPIRLVLDGVPVIAQHVETETLAPGRFTWLGDFQGDGSVILVVRDGRVTGTIWRGNDVYEIRPTAAGGHILTKLDPSTLPPDEPPAFRRRELRSLLRPMSGLPDASGFPSPVQIHLLVAYTPAVEAKRPDIDAFIGKAIVEANRASLFSGVRVRFVLAHSYRTNYTEVGDNIWTDLERFYQPDEYMTEVHALRDQHAADAAVLLVVTKDSCGLAQVDTTWLRTRPARRTSTVTASCTGARLRSVGGGRSWGSAARRSAPGSSAGRTRTFCMATVPRATVATRTTRAC
jgi:hypothetical protein